MEYNKQTLINAAIKKSHDAIYAAEYNFKNGFYSTSQNRLYYAIFYIVTALAYKDNFITSKHSQLMSWFNKRYIYDKKIFNSRLFKIYKETFSCRQKSDYDFLYEINEEELADSINDTKEFIQDIESYLNKH